LKPAPHLPPSIEIAFFVVLIVGATVLVLRDADQFWQDAALPVAFIVVIAVWRWWSRR
jgi:hypothetical protein